MGLRRAVVFERVHRTTPRPWLGGAGPKAIVCSETQTKSTILFCFTAKKNWRIAQLFAVLDILLSSRKAHNIGRKPMELKTTERKFNQISRRELLKVAPVVALGAFAIPRVQESLLKTGVGFSDWASGKLFRQGHFAPTFGDAQLTPFEKFPINGYDVEDPGVDFDAWTLTVTGAVQKPGDYKLETIQLLPKKTQIVRHICVEGWDVIGSFGGVRLSDFLQMIGDRKSV